MKQRLAWIDFLRGLAVLGMIETHAVNSFLAPIFRSGTAFECLSYLHGTVAPTFLFIAGFLQGTSLERHPHAPFLPRLRHLGSILLLGYALQYPWNSALDPAAVIVALGKIDILQCIAVATALLLLSRNLPRARLFLATAVILAAPLVWNSTENFPFPPILGYLNGRHGALFPLFPWAGFLFAGAVFSRCRERSLAAAGLCTAAIGWTARFALADWLNLQTYATRYDAVLFRLSTVLLLCASAAFFLRNNPTGVALRAIDWCGSRSLLLYVFHLILLHSGLGFLPPLRDLFPATQNPMEVAWLFALTLTGSIALTFAWQWLVGTVAAWRMDQR